MHKKPARDTPDPPPPRKRHRSGWRALTARCQLSVGHFLLRAENQHCRPPLVGRKPPKWQHTSAIAAPDIRPRCRKGSSESYSTKYRGAMHAEYSGYCEHTRVVLSLIWPAQGPRNPARGRRSLHSPKRLTRVTPASAESARSIGSVGVRKVTRLFMVHCRDDPSFHSQKSLIILRTEYGGCSGNQRKK